ncbi:nucleolar and spindle-associated protein 1 isoform X2 [Parasteatoda tepidariorum]|uniref:nucleolar and spindle-associated protein 1 isoform X2 n=1 Tax=Parasteatoda tepidariorum TaxID=114398 RepID=UPI001C71E8AE|nr:nucleolar and spindle-associated protein 1-A isoform X2 [Parasteatoda tepidariorum]
MNSFNEESLQKLSNSELKKEAKRKGVKVNMTAEKVIASLLEKSNAGEDSFVAMERSILNSCKKNKEALFDRDSQILSETPKRDTYIVDTPSLNIQAITTSMIMASASPELKQSKDESLNVTINRGSERKNRKSKRKVSFVTPLRRSTRLSVATPQYNSVKGRPKTPMPSRLSSAKKRLSVTSEGTDSISCNLNLDISEMSCTKKTSVGKVRRPSTPMPFSKQKGKKSNSFGDPHDSLKRRLRPSPRIVLRRLKEEDLKKFSAKSTTATPIALPDIKRTPCANENAEATPMPSSNKASVLTPGFKKMVTPFPASDKPKSISSVHRSNQKTPRPQSSKSNALTPGFKKTPFSSSTKTNTPRSLIKSALTPGLTSSAVRKSPRSNIKSTPTSKLTSSAVKKTPNFSKLHQRAFEKMESISDYHQRKITYSQKKKDEQNKILKANSNVSKPMKASMDTKLKKTSKVFSGISFIPSAATTKPLRKSDLKMKIEAKKTTKATKGINGKFLAKAGKVKAIKSASIENTPLMQRRKFDLRASLARKLPYKPHSGPLRPLNEINLNSTVANTSVRAAQKVETKNVVLAKARAQSREVLHGVRKNKRFMLQMNNRNLNVSNV